MNSDVIISLILCTCLLILLTKNIRGNILSLLFFFIGFFIICFYIAILGVWESDFDNHYATKTHIEAGCK